MSRRDSVPTVIERSLPNAVTYDLTSSSHVKITLPPASTWSSGLHWHENHTEYLKVVKGSIKVRVGDKESIVSASATRQPEITVHKYVWHEWQRAESGGDEVIVMERTDPADGEKALFFWNLNGVILDIPKLMSARPSFVDSFPPVLARFLVTVWVELHLMVIFGHLDNFPVYFNAPSSQSALLTWLPQQKLKVVDWIITHFILSAAALTAWILGVQPVTRSYTPAREYANWEAKSHTSNKSQ